MITQPGETIVSTLPLEGLRVGIAGAVPERQFWGTIPDLDRLILTFVAQLSSLVIRYGGSVVHGSHPALAPVVAEQASRQARAGITPLRLFASQLFGEIPEVTRRAARLAQAAVVVTGQIGEGNAMNPETRNRSLTAMRLVMMQHVDVVVAVGGKLHVDTGFNPGVLEELAQARWHNIPCFVVGAFNGAAGQLDHPVLEELSQGNLLEDGKGLMVEMATSIDTMDEYVGKLLAHLARHKDQFRRREPVRNPPSAFRMSVSNTLEQKRLPTPPLQVDVVNVDADVVGAWSTRFAQLKQCVDKKDSDRACKLLSGAPFDEAQ